MRSDRREGSFGNLCGAVGLALALVAATGGCRSPGPTALQASTHDSPTALSAGAPDPKLEPLQPLGVNATADSPIASHDGKLFFLSCAAPPRPAELPFDEEYAVAASLLTFDTGSGALATLGSLRVTMFGSPSFPPIFATADGLSWIDRAGLVVTAPDGSQRVYPTRDAKDAFVEDGVAWIETVEPNTSNVGADTVRLLRLTLSTGATETFATLSPATRALLPAVTATRDAVLLMTGAPRRLLRFDKRGGAPTVLPLPAWTDSRPELTDGALDAEANVGVVAIDSALFVLGRTPEGIALLRFDPPYSAPTTIHTERATWTGSFVTDGRALYYTIVRPPPEGGVHIARTFPDDGRTDLVPGPRLNGPRIAVDDGVLYALTEGDLLSTRVR